MTIRWERGSYVISTDPNDLQLDVIHTFLSNSYWSNNIPRDVMERSIANSLPFGLYTDGHQVGFARVISDCATIAYLGDVFITEPHRGQGLSKWMMEVILSHPKLQGLRRWLLGTLDAHGLYAQFGFTPLSSPERWMERWDPNVYERT